MTAELMLALNHFGLKCAYRVVTSELKVELCVGLSTRWNHYIAGKTKQKVFVVVFWEKGKYIVGKKKKNLNYSRCQYSRLCFFGLFVLFYGREVQFFLSTRNYRIYCN